ncbi:hypothetical protein M427DRAFT_132197 [Gonapodya prolifera JEL478]|uniref:F-box domain-containing protein n=1 Tax=Gonapodya prolifera (strain JEL478) TaxID=1344416 RepID=A0A139ARM2_GONPJ|nr:hypothetical protein M427DRAFT_132197 [Gonapodya prolifera JEL478]|eukprot:KXS19173.1 hypothetical protein M427DRAFT_132197 [Gonapodya prolifera JEL478]
MPRIDRSIRPERTREMSPTKNVPKDPFKRGFLGQEYTTLPTRSIQHKSSATSGLGLCADQNGTHHSNSPHGFEEAATAFLDWQRWLTILSAPIQSPQSPPRKNGTRDRPAKHCTDYTDQAGARCWKPGPRTTNLTSQVTPTANQHINQPAVPVPDLPIEMLHHIFSYLDQTEVYPVRYVNPLWDAAVATKYIRSGSKIMLTVCDASIVDVSRTNGGVDLVGYNIVWKCHLVRDRETRRTISDPAVRIITSPCKDTICFTPEEMARYDLYRDPRMDDLASPMTRRPREQAVVEFLSTANRDEYIKLCTRKRSTFDVSM